MPDYRLSRMFYDLHTDRALAERYRADRDAVIARYDLAPDLVDALGRDDVACLAAYTNGFLLRYYFIAAGMGEADFLARLRKIGR